MAWIYLIIAGLLEVVWASLLKRTDGFTRLGPSVVTVGVMCVSFYLLGVALKTLPTGTGYAVWVGIGAVGTALVGMLFLVSRRVSCGSFRSRRSSLGLVGLRLAEGG